MTAGQTPMELLRAMMQDYEQQWRSAQGHARRHPLRIKMLQLENLMQRNPDAAELDRILAEGATGDNWELSLLCGDLEPRWRAVRSG